MHHDRHVKQTLRLYGVRGDDIQLFLDQFWPKYRIPHRRLLHHQLGIEFSSGNLAKRLPARPRCTLSTTWVASRQHGSNMIRILFTLNPATPRHRKRIYCSFMAWKPMKGCVAENIRWENHNRGICPKVFLTKEARKKTPGLKANP
jgi:hypothetical protein